MAEPAISKPRLGLWLIGARGGVAATSLVGWSALRRGLIRPVGLVTALPRFARLPWADWCDYIIGGHEIRAARLLDEAGRLSWQSHAIEQGLIDRCAEDLQAIDRRIRPGSTIGVGRTIESLADANLPRGETAAEAVVRLRADLAQFRGEHRLEHVVVLNVASTEPAVDPAPLPARWSEMARLLPCRDCPLPASTLYAIAALQEGCSYINFTPSLGSSPPAIDELARLNGSRHMGCDGKTGETLLKSVLAPMFRQRNLDVLSWVGHNIFGNMDGQVLNDPVNKQTKLASKTHLLEEILGYRPESHVSIEYISSLGDWKTAWDHIHFEGFLGTRMVMQFIWQGCDSLLAAPLVLDLARFTELAWRRGETGCLTFLASFFKSPYQVSEHHFDRQYQMLEAWAAAQ